MLVLKYFFILITFLLIELVTSSSPKDDLIIELSHKGRIQGVEDESTWSKKPFLAFKGIPYAQPPVESLRFQPPVKHEGWTDVRESKYSSICAQLNATVEDLVDGDEDCLYLNVFTPASAIKSTKEEPKLPVLILIHGGGFQYESGQDYGPNYWMEENLVYVTFNYRLGMLGFLQTSDGTTIAGNMGLKDQVLALKWVQDNIEYFGGDPDQVTLMGVSSGAVSVHLHMLSEMSQGLFQRAISQSGTALAPWAIVKADKTARTGKNTGCTKNTTEEYVACLKDLPFDELVKSQAKYADWFIDPIVPVGPVLEKKPEGAFLTKSPYKLIREGNFKPIPWIVGVNSDEGLLHVNDILKHPMLTHVLHWEWVKAAPITLIYRGASFDDVSISTRIKTFYFDEQKIGRDVYKELINMYSDRYFFHGTHHSAKLHAALAPVYLYLFDYEGSESDILAYGIVDEGAGVDAEVFDKIGTGVRHYDQLQYLFNTPYFSELTEPEHLEIANQMRKKFMSFIRTGGVKDWKKVSKKAASGEEPLKYNIIGKDPRAIDEPWTERVQFWDKLGLMELDRELDSILSSMNLGEEDKTDEQNNAQEKDEL